MQTHCVLKCHPLSLNKPRYRCGYLLLLSNNGGRTAGIHVKVLDSPEFLWTVMLIMAVTHGSMMYEDKADRCRHVVYSDWISSSPFLSCYYGYIITRHSTCKINIKYDIFSSTFGYRFSSAFVLQQECWLVIYKSKQKRYQRDWKGIEYGSEDKNQILG